MHVCVYWYSYAEILTPNMKMLVNGAFRRQLGHESGTLIDGIRFPYKRDSRKLSCRFHEDMTFYEPGSESLSDTEYASALSWTLRLQNSEK